MAWLQPSSMCFFGRSTPWQSYLHPFVSIIYVCYGTWSRILHKKKSRPSSAGTLRCQQDRRKWLWGWRSWGMRSCVILRLKKKRLKMINSKKRCFLDDRKIYWYWNARFLSLVFFSFTNFESYLYVYSWLEAIPIIVNCTESYHICTENNQPIVTRYPNIPSGFLPFPTMSACIPSTTIQLSNIRNTSCPKLPLWPKNLLGTAQHIHRLQWQGRMCPKDSDGDLPWAFMPREPRRN